MLAVLEAVQLPCPPAQRHIVPALLAGNAVVFKPPEKTPATGAFLRRLLPRRRRSEGVIRLLIGGPDEGRALASEPGIDGLLHRIGTRRHGAPPAGRQCPTRFSRSNSAAIIRWSWDTPDIQSAAVIAVRVRLSRSAGQRRTAARRLIVKDGARGADRWIGRLIDRIIIDHPHADPQPWAP